MKKLFLILALIFIIPSKAYAEDNYFEIKIGNSATKIELTSDKNFSLVDTELNKIQDLGVKNISAELVNGKIFLKSGDRVLSQNFPSKGEFKLASESFIKLKNKYRGYFQFEIENNKLNAINYIELEDYLKGVVNNELDYSHPMESLKTQAITSRTFALSNKNKYAKQGYNLTDTTSSQVYRGQSSEHEKTTKAVNETKGMYLTMNAKPISAIFGASSGGVIADAKEVWGGDYSYLKRKEDPYSSDYKWELKLSKQDFIKKISKKYPLYDISVINIVETDSSGRVKEVEILGDKIYNIKASELRSILGSTKMKSTLYTVQTGDEIIFNGKGYGHGVGLSQYGAVNMAKEGKEYEEILQFYFPGTILTK
ncbi:SpoIID/LytB domain-containing protein [Peptoniphilus asaccharolyticus]